MSTWVHEYISTGVQEYRFHEYRGERKFMDKNGVISEMQLKQKKIFCASDRKFYRKHWGGGCNYELELLCLDRIVNLTVCQIKIIISLSVWFIFILFAKLPSCEDCKALTFNENISNTKSKLLSIYPRLRQFLCVLSRGDASLCLAGMM